MTSAVSDDLYYILYVSQAERPMSDSELADILEISRKNNVQHAITGLLLYKLWRSEKRANFLQILEGPRQAVETAFRKIARDKRHHTVIGLEKGTLSQRNFADWAMGFKNLNTDDLRSFPGFRDVDMDSFNPDKFHEQIQPALETIKLFYEVD